MSLCLEQIERGASFTGDHSRKWLKQQRNRKIRRVKKTEKPNIKYNGWEY